MRWIPLACRVATMFSATVTMSSSLTDQGCLPLNLTHRRGVSQPVQLLIHAGRQFGVAPIVRVQAVPGNPLRVPKQPTGCAVDVVGVDVCGGVLHPVGDPHERAWPIIRMPERFDDDQARARQLAAESLEV